MLVVGPNQPRGMWPSGRIVSTPACVLNTGSTRDQSQKCVS